MVESAVNMAGQTYIPTEPDAETVSVKDVVQRATATLSFEIIGGRVNVSAGCINIDIALRFTDE